MNKDDPVELGDIGLSMAFYGMLTAVASIVIAIVSGLIVSIVSNDDFSDFRL